MVGGLIGLTVDYQASALAALSVVPASAGPPTTFNGRLQSTRSAWFNKGVFRPRLSVAPSEFNINFSEWRTYVKSARRAGC